MARIKTRRSSSATTATPPPPNPNVNANQNNQNEDGESSKIKNEEGESSESCNLLPLLTSAITLSLRFLSDSDLLLLPSQSLTLHSLLRSSALSLSSILSSNPQIKKIPNLINLPPSPSPSPSIISPFPWFRRFLASSTSPSDPRWLDNFRMSKPSFYLLLQTLSPSLLSLSSSPTSPVPPDHKLAAALFRLAHAAPFSLVARLFGLNSPSLAARAFYETLRAVSLRLPHLFHLSSDAPRIIHGFNYMSLPNCCGVLAFSRFPVSSGSLIAQCLLDSEGRFLDVSVGWHGSLTPAQILPQTKLYTAQSAVLGCNGGGRIELVGGTCVPRYFIGGSCCPLLPWLLTPYKDSDLDATSKAVVFNTVHARGMELAERAISRLRTRWKLLKTEWNEEVVEGLPYVVAASCLLHNYLVKCTEPVPEEDAEGRYVEMAFKEFEGKGDEGRERIRDAIASHLSQVICK